MLAYNEFKENFRKELEAYLGDGFTVEENVLQKATGEKECVTISYKKGTEKSCYHAKPCLQYEPIFEAYKSGLTMENIMNIYGQSFRESFENRGICDKFLEILEKAKKEGFPMDLITARLANTEMRSSFLENLITREYLDLSVYYALELPEGSVNITKKMAEEYGLEEEALYNAGIAHAEENLLFERLDSLFPMIPYNKIRILSNESISYGASAMLSSAVLEKIEGVFGGGFCMIPSSIHEMMILPVEFLDEQEIISIIKSVNEEITKDEFLSDSLYIYDPESKKINVIKDKNDGSEEVA